MVFGARLRTVMSSIIRWRKGETLRAVGMESPMDFVLSMACHNSRKSSPRPLSNLTHTKDRLEEGRLPGVPRSGLVQFYITGGVFKTCRYCPCPVCQHCGRPSCETGN